MKFQLITSVLIILGLSLCFTGIAKAEDKREKKEEHEKQVDISKVPVAVKAAIMKEVGDGKITKVLVGSDTEGGKPTYYEAKYKKDDKKREVKVDPEGKVIANDDDDD